MRCKRLIALGLIGFLAMAQNGEEASRPDFRVSVTDIVVPVSVHDRDGNVVNGLQPRNFRLFDNEKEQEIAVDVSYHPISMVIAVQANGSVESILPQVKKIGSMLEQLVVGDQGEAAVLAFDHRFQVKQDFTSDIALISEGLKKITPGSSSSRMIDAITYGVRLLRNRPQNRRRVLLLLSETRDIASEGKLRDAVVYAELSNVTIYTVNMSRMIATLMGKPQPPRVSQLPPAMTPMPSSVPATPTTVIQKGSAEGSAANFMPLLLELYRDVKAVFKDNPAEALTKATGGQEFHFMKQRGLEEAIAKIGEELHSQYIITYSPNNKEEGGYHEIKVALSPERGDWKVKARPGYWLASVH